MTKPKKNQANNTKPAKNIFKSQKTESNSVLNEFRNQCKSHFDILPNDDKIIELFPQLQYVTDPNDGLISLCVKSLLYSA